jgi:nucleoid DNA-binding protein
LLLDENEKADRGPSAARPAVANGRTEQGGEMTKADLVEQVAEAIGPGITKKDCALVVDGLLNAIKNAMSDHAHIEIRGFGTFKVRKRRSRMARNPRTGEPVEVPARAVPIFKPSKDLRVQVSEGTKVPMT